MKLFQLSYMFVSAWSRVSVNPKKCYISELQFGTHRGADSVYTLRSFPCFCDITKHKQFLFSSPSPE